MNYFNFLQYTGKWYENRKYFAIFEFGQKCITATYTIIGEATVEVKNEGLQIL